MFFLTYYYTPKIYFLITYSHYILILILSYIWLFFNLYDFFFLTNLSNICFSNSIVIKVFIVYIVLYSQLINSVFSFSIIQMIKLGLAITSRTIKGTEWNV